jgi:hypothetical protein
MESKFYALVEAILTLLSGLAPGAIGAAVGMVWRKGLTWRERFVQLAVGIVVSWFVTRAIGALWPIWFRDAADPFVMQAIAFTIGMIAFEATPRFIAGASDVIGGLPALIRDRLIGKGK